MNYEQPYQIMPDEPSLELEEHIALLNPASPKHLALQDHTQNIPSTMTIHKVQSATGEKSS